MNARLVRILAWSIAALFAPTTALGQPAITNHPRTQFQWANRFVSLNVAATGMAPLAYRWQFDGTDIPKATNRTYNMLRVALTNDGTYRVLVTDTTGITTSQVARVMVRDWPRPTGPVIPELARLDTNMMTIMLANNVPGGSLAVVKDGRLVLARGYGFADVENREPFQPDSLCRGASLSKLITAATAMKLVEDGKIDLDAPVLPVLNLDVPEYPGAAFDSRWTNVTLRHCLNHTGGWNEGIAKDPLGATGFVPSYWPDRIAHELGLASATPIDVVRWMLGKPLQSRPGAGYSYSNFGYEVAGSFIAKTAHAPYERAARALLSMSGISRMRPGADIRADRGPGEAACYVHPSITPGWARLESEPRPFDFELPYAWPISLRPASAGWVMSTIEYARFVASIDNDPAYPDVLATNSVAMMAARPKSSTLSDETYYGMGLNVRPGIGLWWHSGVDPGARSFWARTRNGVVFVLTMNTYWEASGGLDLWSTFSPILDGIRSWPAHDLFPNTLSYDAWETRHLGKQGALAFGYGSDPDGDGVPNLVEYSQGTDPLAPSARPSLTVAVERADGKVTLSIGYRRLLLAHEVDYSLEASENLESWSLVSGEASEPLLDPDGTVMVQTRMAAPKGAPVRFFRLVVARRNT